MVRMSVLSDCLKSIINAEKAGKRQVSYPLNLISYYRFSSDPSQRSWSSSLELCKRTVRPYCNPHRVSLGYISEFEIVDDKRAGKIVVELNGRLNKCGVISPRYDLKLKDFEKFIYHILPSRQFGKVILTTTFGIMDHEEAKRKHIGGKVLGYFYWLNQGALKQVLILVTLF